MQDPLSEPGWTSRGVLQEPEASQVRGPQVGSPRGLRGPALTKVVEVLEQRVQKGLRTGRPRDRQPGLLSHREASGPQRDSADLADLPPLGVRFRFLTGCARRKSPRGFRPG